MVLFFKKIIWAITNEKAHLYSPLFGARAKSNTNRVKGSSGSHRTARTGALGHSTVLRATAQLRMHGAAQTRLQGPCSTKAPKQPSCDFYNLGGWLKITF